MSKKINTKYWAVCFIAFILTVTFCLPAVAQETQLTQKKSKKQQDLPYAIQDGTSMSSITVKNYEDLAKLYEQERTQGRRNRLIFMAVSQIDLHFRSYERKRRHRNNLFQTLINILEVGAATAISLTNGERAKTVIADGLGFIQGSRDSINKNYRLMERQILVNKMVEKRAKILAAIYERVTMTEEQYPFERAFIDLLDYFEAGRMDSALNELAKDSGATAVNAETALKAAKKNADIKLFKTAEQVEFSNKSAKTVQTIIDSEIAASDKIANAGKKIKAAEKVIESDSSTDEEKTKATQDKSQAETDKKAAEVEQAAAMDKMKKIFKSIKDDESLSELLKDLPEMYPNLTGKINESLNRIDEDKGTATDYASILLKFYQRVTDAVADDPQIGVKAAKTLDSVK